MLIEKLKLRTHFKLNLFLSPTLILFLFFLTSTPKSKAQVSQNTLSDSQPQYELGAGALLLNIPDYPGSSNNRFRMIPFPFYIYRGEYLRSDDEGSRARLFSSKNHEFGLSFSFNFPVRSNNNIARAGMPDLDSLIAVGPRILFRLLDKKSNHKLNFTIAARANYSSNFKSRFRAEGMSFEPRFNHWYRWEEQKITVFSGFGFEFGSVEINRFFYDVPFEFTNPQRSIYSSKSGLIEASASFGIGASLTPSVFLFAATSLRNLDWAANHESPLVETRNNQAYILGLIWTFYESQERVKKL